MVADFKQLQKDLVDKLGAGGLTCNSVAIVTGTNLFEGSEKPPLGVIPAMAGIHGRPHPHCLLVPEEALGRRPPAKR